MLTADEVATTLRGFWWHELEHAVILSSVLGLRPGETYGMRWSVIYAYIEGNWNTSLRINYIIVLGAWSTSNSREQGN